MDPQIETDRLSYYRNQSSKLRIDDYTGLCDYISNRIDITGVNAGKIFILPSSHSGSVRCLMQRYQDAMAISRHVKKDPNWPEIKAGLIVLISLLVFFV